MLATSWLTQGIGWLSSCMLLATIVQQLVTQWRSGSSRGVSPWLFAGQTASSVGFTVYSALLKNWVFTVTNALMLLSALVGCWITYSLRKHPRKPS